MHGWATQEGRGESVSNACKLQMTFEKKISTCCGKSYSRDMGGLSLHGHP